MQDFEKLGSFYLGRPFDLRTGKTAPVPLLYASRDLTTHAVCVGMTGSGKTGLCLSLLEEAAIDGIPAIVIDPKGDLANLLLLFPDLRPEDFAPWINEDDARRQGITPEDFARGQAELWRQGLSDWGQDGARMARLRDAADFAVYTPGSSAGLPVNVLKSLAAPPAAILGDAEALAEQVRTMVSGLLGLAGLEADPLASREHIFLANLVQRAWQGGRDLDLASLIQLIQNPPMEKLGVLDLESFYPGAERFALAMRLNNLLASPGFASWITGEPLDIASMLHTPAGKPRVSIFSIAHLSDSERMFFVTMLLNQTLGWVRTQPGTTSLRALVYMDEIFGYFPPVANPPSKLPLLTLLKQARAFGVGVVLATQNPVDLDYKGLANAGTWFIGRLQTERDKARVLDGLEGAAATASSNFDRSKTEAILSSLGNRVFLLNNVHEDAPVVFQTRWALSYLRGPLTRSQISQLMAARKAGGTTPATSTTKAMPAPATETAARPAGPPVLPPKVSQCFLPLRTTKPAGASLVYRPVLLGTADVFYQDTKAGVSAQDRTSLLAPLTSGPMAADWATAQPVAVDEADLDPAPAAAAEFAPLPASAAQATSYEAWRTAFADAVYRLGKVELLESPSLKVVSQPGESERDFRARIAQSSREARDAQAEKLRQKYAPKLAALAERFRKAEAAKEVQAQQASASKLQTAISFGASILGAFLGRKLVSASNLGRAATAAKSVGRSLKESQDVARAGENLEAIQSQMAELEAQFQAEVQALEARFDSSTEALRTMSLRPKRTDIRVRLVSLAWAPHWQVAGQETAAWE